MDRPRILCVDDEPVNLSNLALTLADEYDVLTAGSGAEALAVLERTGDVAVVIADHRMPGMTGVELLERVLRAHPDPVRVILTAYVNVDDILDAINRGCVYHYLLKPWDEPDLRATLRRATEAWRLGRENRRLVGELARKNDELERRVAERTAELERARDELEERVAERTAELRRTHRQLLHAEKLGAVGQLASSIAHEFNNPIFGIQNVLRTLGDGPDLAASERELLGLALGECARVTRLIRDLQAFNRPSSDVLSPTDVHRAIDSLLIFCKKDFSVRRIDLDKRYAGDLPLVRAVEDQLKQVVLNLLTNARDAMPEGGGRVLVETEAREDRVVIRVKDTGRGIAPEHLDRVFEPFFTTKSTVKGTGLGLSVSHGIVRSHGGTMEVESRPGQGSTFSVILPVGG